MHHRSMLLLALLLTGMSSAHALANDEPTQRDETAGDEAAGDEDEAAGDEAAGDEAAGDEAAGDEAAGDEAAGDEAAAPTEETQSAAEKALTAKQLILSNPDRATELVLEALREQPHNGVWRSLYALLLSRAGRPCEASKQYQLAISDLPSHLRPKQVDRAKEAKQQCQP